MLRGFLAAFLMLFFVGCGKNDLGVVGPGPGYSSGPITQAPYYPQQPYSPSNGGYPPPNAGYPAPTFSPQIPSGMPPQFYPWIPMYNYFMMQPQYNYLWGNIWSSWIVYANRVGCGIYNFPIFWNTYFPVYWNYGPYILFYRYMSAVFYPWMIPGVVIPPIVNPVYFWSNYMGLPIYGANYGGWFW